MATALSRKATTKRPAEPEVRPDPPAAYGVFLEHEYPVSEPMEPILLRRCINNWEAIGWRDGWAVDEPDFLNAKMVIRPIDADGNVIEEGA
jgi:hypothetical protein